MKKDLNYTSYIYEDIRSLESAFKREDYNTVVAVAAQIAEKCLKAITQKNRNMSNSELKGKKGHNLIYFAKNCGTNIEISDNDLKQLQDGYYKARYPDGNKKYNKDDAIKLGEIAYKLLDKLIEVLDIPNQELFEEIGDKPEIAFFIDIRYVIPNITIEEANSLLNENTSIKEYIKTKCPDKFQRTVVENIIKKYRKITRGQVLNHTIYPILPSNENKVHLHYDAPIPTITICLSYLSHFRQYMHPVHERSFSVREAARFQTFPDTYYFFGGKQMQLRQVCAAVPVVLAYQIAEKIVDLTQCTRLIDLFCGVGGITKGFKDAGIKSVLSNDIQESDCMTLKINNPEIPVLCGDITEPEIKDKIVDTAKESGANIICSNRFRVNLRTQLYNIGESYDTFKQLCEDFIDIVARIKPKVVVMFENERWSVYKMNLIRSMLSEIGYNTESKILNVNEYAVPQMRRYSITICTRNDLQIAPEDLFPTPITLEKPITARETIKDLEEVECSEDAVYSDECDIKHLFRGKISYSNFIAAHRGKNCVSTYNNSNQICSN